MTRKKGVWILLLLMQISYCISAKNTLQNTVVLENNILEIQWKKSSNKTWLFDHIRIHSENISCNGNEKGTQYLLYTENRPASVCDTVFQTRQGAVFPEPEFGYSIGVWKDHITPVSLNQAGEKDSITAFRLISRNPLTFSADTKYGSLTTQWTLYENEMRVSQQFTANKTGYYSLSTPQLFQSNSENLERAVVPGYLFADDFSDDFVASYGYGYHIPNIPTLYRDKCSTTPAAILSTKNGITVGVAPEASYPRRPHHANGNSHNTWGVGISMSPGGKTASPAIYYPVLGEENSYLQAGETLRFEYRYIISKSDWYDVFKQIVYKVYDFKQTEIIRNRTSLSQRINKMLKYVSDEKSSLFRIVNYEGVSIGAQEYWGGVSGSQSDALKNSDYGAIWMMATLSGDTTLCNKVLPYVRNFKLQQVYAEPGKFQGAVKGQYYLWKSQRFVEEWGDYIEPMGVCYYALCDLGNILLFRPDDAEAKERLRFAAEYLYNVQLEDGGWHIGIRKSDDSVIYPDISNFRPTFYGMLIAYDWLGDEKYLQAARKGADWLIENAIEKGRFIGVCGDTRLSPDFATAQTAQTLLDLYDRTSEIRYLEAAVKTAKIYATSIYTYPNGQTEMQRQGNQSLPGWAFSQAGLSFEHGGTIGSANTRGPILLAGFAGCFIRMYQLTGDSLFLDMARAAANGKDAFVNPNLGVASYYWDSFNEGPGPFPQHAWWQIGWLTDYLVAEAEMRSGGSIAFPRGYSTAKVGPHKILGFAPGVIDGQAARLIIRPNLLSVNNPLCETLLAESDDTLFVMAMNSSNEKINVSIGLRSSASDCKSFWNNTNNETIEIESYGIKIIKFNKQ